MIAPAGQAAERTPGQPEDRPAVYVVLPGLDADWGIDASRVQSIVAAAEWRGVEPLNLACFTGAVYDETLQSSRILVVDTAAGRLPMLTGGRLSLRNVAAGAVQKLPDSVLSGAVGVALSGVVMAEGQPPLFIVNVDALRRSSQLLDKRS